MTDSPLHLELDAYIRGLLDEGRLTVTEALIPFTSPEPGNPHCAVSLLDVLEHLPCEVENYRAYLSVLEPVYITLTRVSLHRRKTMLSGAECLDFHQEHKYGRSTTYIKGVRNTRFTLANMWISVPESQARAWGITRHFQDRTFDRLEEPAWPLSIIHPF